MFLLKEELKTHAYEYQLDEITEGDDTIVDSAIATAIDEVKSYLTIGNQVHFKNGMPLYDVEAIFSKTGADRHALILGHTKNCAKWWVLELSNVDIIYEHVKERYDRSIAFLTKVQRGEINIHGLDVLDPEEDELAAKDPFRSGSRKKFNHDL